MEDMQCKQYCFHFDETTTSQIKKQYDGYIPYFSKKYNQVVCEYAVSLFIGHCPAEALWLLKWCKNVILHNIYSINPFVYAIKTFMHSIIQHVDAIIAFVDSILQHVYAIKAFMHLIIQYGWEIVLPLCSFTQTDYVIKLSISTKQ